MATNKEFYGDKLLALAIWNENKCQLLHELFFDKDCAEKKCVNCEFATAESIEKWLNAEHVEPEPQLLKNGNDLEPGEWIMVRNDDEFKWQKRCFMCYRYGYFITVSGGHSICTIGGYEAWKQARLPMEGE